MIENLFCIFRRLFDLSIAPFRKILFWKDCFNVNTLSQRFAWCIGRR